MKVYRQHQIQYRFHPHISLATALLCVTVTGITYSPALAKHKIKLEKLVPKLDKLPPPLLLKTGIGTSVEVPSNINDFGYSQNQEAFPCKVTFVEPGSNAWKGGLQSNDKLISASFNTRGADLVVERAGKKYYCHIEPVTVLTKRHIVDAKTFFASATIKEPGGNVSDDMKSLTKYEIVLLVDSSASMNTNDCPDGKTRWSWCQSQAGNLLNENLLKGKISIGLFGTNYSASPHCQISDLPAIFKSNSASGETNMAGPIRDALAGVSSQLYAQRPAVIAIITDGRPTDVEKVRKLLIDTANGLRDPSLLTVAFIEIGTAEKYLKEFDTDLVKQGAKADIVSLYPFSEVNSQGLVKVLAKAVSTPKMAPVPVKLTPEEAKKQEAQMKLQATIKAEAEKKAQREAQSKVLQEAANRSYSFPTPDTVSINKAPPKPGPGIITPKTDALKAHPSGTLRSVPVTEINEKESVLKEGANKVYSFPKTGTK